MAKKQAGVELPPLRRFKVLYKLDSDCKETDVHCHGMTVVDAEKGVVVFAEFARSPITASGLTELHRRVLWGVYDVEEVATPVQTGSVN